MSFYVYLIATNNEKKITTYVGYTNNLERRLKLHNEGKGAKFTRGRKWKILYSEKFKTKNEAIRAEHKLKKNRNFRNKIKRR